MADHPGDEQHGAGVSLKQQAFAVYQQIGVAALGAQLAGVGVGGVVQKLGALQDPLPHFRGHAAFYVVQRKGGGSRRNACHLRHVF